MIVQESKRVYFVCKKNLKSSCTPDSISIMRVLGFLNYQHLRPRWYSKRGLLLGQENTQILRVLGH